MIDTALGRAMIHWNLSRPSRVAETRDSVVLRVEQKSGRLAALRIFKSDAAAERRSADLLAWYGGEGAVEVLGLERGAVLMEWIDGKRLSEPAMSGHDDQATEAIGYLVQQLHRPREAPPADLVPLKDWFAPLFAAQAQLWPTTARDLYGRAKGIALGLFDRAAADVPLHGDLRHDNILASPRGWLAIDPRGLLGDPIYDLAAAFLNPWQARDMVIDQGRIAHMADSFARRFGHDRKRILGFAVAHAALSVCWDIRDGRPIGHQIAALPSLLAVYAQA